MNTVQTSNGVNHILDTVQYPVSVAVIRERALVAAGFTPETVGAFMKKATEKLIDKLDATTTKFFTEKGQITDRVEVVDHTTQLSAATALIGIGIDVMGLKRRTERVETNETPRVVIDLSGWSVQPTVSPNGSTEVFE